MTVTRSRDFRPIVRVHCAEVPASLPECTVARWIRALPGPRGSLLARRIARGTGLASLTGLALLASFAFSCRLPSLSHLRWTLAGKPYFAGGPEFSLTHSGGFAACALAPRGLPVGIDIEPADRASAAMIAFVAGDAEREALDAGLLSPTGLWTVKEAVLKAAGVGLADMCAVAIDRRQARLADVRYGWRHFCPRRGLLLAVAAQDRLPRVGIRWPDPASVFA